MCDDTDLSPLSSPSMCDDTDLSPLSSLMMMMTIDDDDVIFHTVKLSMALYTT